MTINEKLLEIQLKLKAPKSQYNNFGKYNYRNCEDILEAVKPLLKEQGLTLRLSDEIVLVGERYYVKATAILSDGETSISTTASAREEETKKGMDASQITGSSSSYARKYALNGMFAIDDNKDSDYTNKGDNITPQQRSQPKGNVSKPTNSNAPITPETMKAVNIALTRYKEKAHIETKKLLKHINDTMHITIDTNMTEQQAKMVISRIESWEKKLEEVKANA